MSSLSERRLQAEVARGSYPFEAGDEGELFARAVWLEDQRAALLADLEQAKQERDEADSQRNEGLKSEAEARGECLALEMAATAAVGRYDQLRHELTKAGKLLLDASEGWPADNLYERGAREALRAAADVSEEDERYVTFFPGYAPHGEHTVYGPFTLEQAARTGQGARSHASD